MDDFPYKRQYLSKDEIITRFKHLKTLKNIKYVGKQYKFLNNNLEPIIQVLNQPICFPSMPELYYYNILSDYFTEPQRMLSRRFDHELSPMQFWHKRKRIVIDKCQSTFGTVNTYLLREQVEAMFGHGMANTFRISNVGLAKELFGSKRMLDFSSGWGDRLIGAMAFDFETYHGCDPNPRLHDSYKQIIQAFKDHTSCKCQIYPVGAEVMPLDFSYDLILTSPPYFDLEIYNESDPGQSINKHKTTESWYRNWLLVVLKRLWHKLELNGNMMLFIDQKRGSEFDYMTQLVHDMMNIPGCKYLGTACYCKYVEREIVGQHPIIFFQKSTTINFQINNVPDQSNFIDLPGIGRCKYTLGVLHDPDVDPAKAPTESNKLKSYIPNWQGKLNYDSPAFFEYTYFVKLDRIKTSDYTDQKAKLFSLIPTKQHEDDTIIYINWILLLEFWRFVVLYKPAKLFIATSQKPNDVPTIYKIVQDGMYWIIKS
jgi:hypothetical protein